MSVRVVKAAVSDSDPMPFADGEFELVLDRHAAFNPVEVVRRLGVAYASSWSLHAGDLKG